MHGKVREIHLDTVLDLEDKKLLGKYSDPSDYDEVIREDCDVYLPSGELAIAYRRAAIKSLVDISDERYDYWRWVSVQNPSIGRGAAAGSEIITHLHRRFRLGQLYFIEQAAKGKWNDATYEECVEFIDSNPVWSKQNIVIRMLRADKLYDVEKCEPWERQLKSARRQKKFAEAERIEKLLVEHRQDVWIKNWLKREFIPAEDREKAAQYACQMYKGRESYNEVWSNVVGAFDRQVLVPFCRMTDSTVAKIKQFEAERPFYKEVDKLFKKHMPDKHKFLGDIFKNVVDPRYNLWGTVFTTITVNNNFRVAYHRDGNNCRGGIAALTTINKGTYDGYDFIFPEFRLAFELRDGDFLVGDNQGFIHGMSAMENASEDAEAIWFVFYSRENLRHAESWDCEQCRRSFMRYAKDHHQDKGSGKPTWNGIWAGMWTSPEWTAYKKANNREECSDTHYNFSDKRL